MEKSQEKPVNKSQQNCQADTNGKFINLGARPKNMKNLTRKKNAQTTTENQVQNIMDLPNEMLLEILEFLSLANLRKMAQVSKRLYRLAWDQTLIMKKIKKD